MERCQRLNERIRSCSWPTRPCSDAMLYATCSIILAFRDDPVRTRTLATHACNRLTEREAHWSRCRRSSCSPQRPWCRQALRFLRSMAPPAARARHTAHAGSPDTASAGARVYATPRSGLAARRSCGSFLGETKPRGRPATSWTT
jgi:hypothetical protein